MPKLIRVGLLQFPTAEVSTVSLTITTYAVKVINPTQKYFRFVKNVGFSPSFSFVLSCVVSGSDHDDKT